MGVQQRKEQEREIRRKDIIGAAERVFFSKGYDAATMDEVAKEAEFSKRTVYAYFDSKEQLYYEIMIRGYCVLLGMLGEEEHALRKADAVEALRRMFLVFYRFSMQHYAYFSAIMAFETKNPGKESGVPQESVDECYRLGEKVLEYLADIMARGVADGDLRAGLDLGKTALVLWACAIGIFNTVKMKESYLLEYHDETPESFISAAFDLIVCSLRP